MLTLSSVVNSNHALLTPYIDAPWPTTPTPTPQASAINWITASAWT